MTGRKLLRDMLIDFTNGREAVNQDDKDELNTWQEIGAYFHVSYRTVQVWHKDRGLPVKKVGGRVVALKEELDQWKREQMNSRIPKENVEAADPAEPISKVSESSPRSRRRFLVPALLGVVISAAALAFWWPTTPHRQPASYTIEGRLLSVFDERNQWLWEHVFPDSLSETKRSGRDWPHRFVDLAGDGRIGLIFSAHKLLYYFDHAGRVIWTHRPGREVRWKQGIVPANYSVTLVDALSKPQHDGGRVIVGSYRGPGALFVVELLNKDGKAVGEYFHFGWFFGVKTGALGNSGHEDILLAGVDNASGTVSDYSATLVVLDPDRVSGQAATLAADPRAMIDVPAAREKAVLLIKEFAQSPDPNDYCRGMHIDVAENAVDLIVNQGPDATPGCHFRFDQNLHLLEVIPQLKLLEILRRTILTDVPADRWQEVLKKSLGDIRYVRNEFE